MEIFLGIDYILQAFFFCLVDEMLQEARIFLYVITAEVGSLVVDNRIGCHWRQNVFHRITNWVISGTIGTLWGLQSQTTA